jgi:hypothetical protein
VPPFWSELMQRCWEHDAARRPSFGEVVQAIQAEMR